MRTDSSELTPQNWELKCPKTGLVPPGCPPRYTSPSLEQWGLISSHLWSRNSPQDVGFVELTDHTDGQTLMLTEKKREVLQNVQIIITLPAKLEYQHSITCLDCWGDMIELERYQAALSRRYDTRYKSNRSCRAPLVSSCSRGHVIVVFRFRDLNMKLDSRFEFWWIVSLLWPLIIDNCLKVWIICWKTFERAWQVTKYCQWN